MGKQQHPEVLGSPTGTQIHAMGTMGTHPGDGEVQQKI